MVTEKGLVESAWKMRGRQLSTPLAKSIAALVGATGRPKVSVCVGVSESVAALVMEKYVPGVIVRSEIAASVGGVFVPAAVTLRVAVELLVNPPVLITFTKYEPASAAAPEAML